MGWFDIRMLQRLIFSTNTRLSIIILLIQSQSWLREGGKKLGHFLFPFIFTRTPTLAAHTWLLLLLLLLRRAAPIISSPVTLIFPFFPFPLKAHSRSHTAATRASYRRRYFWWSDLPWLDARCVHPPLRRPGETFTFGTARVRGRLHSPGGTRWARNACQRRLASAPRSPHRRAAASASSSTLRLAPGSRTDHAQIIIKGGVGGGASGP